MHQIITVRSPSTIGFREYSCISTPLMIALLSVYYFNGVTGESTWEKPTPTFPDVSPDGVKSTDEKKDGGGLFGAIFGSDKKKNDGAPQQLLDADKITTNSEDFLSELDDVIAEAEEAIKIAEEIENEPAKKGGLFSSFGFGKKEATAESLIADVEERTSKIEEAVSAGEKKGLFSMFGGGKTKKEKVETAAVTDTTVESEENVWTEGLKNLFKR